MCQPSASKAIELKVQPAQISTTIVVAVIHITAFVLRSAAALPLSKRWSCIQGVKPWVCIASSALGTVRSLRIYPPNGPSQSSNAYGQGLVAEPGMQSGIVGAFVIAAPTWTQPDTSTPSTSETTRRATNTQVLRASDCGAKARPARRRRFSLNSIQPVPTLEVLE